MDFGPWHSGVLTAMMLAIAWPCHGEEEAAAGPEIVSNRSISASGQFHIYGNDPTDRGAFCRYAEELRGGLTKVLRTSGDWKYPIVIQVHTRNPTAAARRHVNGAVRPTDDGFRFQVDVLLTEGFSREDFRDELLRLLILERMLGGDAANREPLRKDRLLPHWLHLGIAELARYRHEGTPNEIYDTILTSHRALPIADILETDPTGMNSVSRIVFEASAAALVRALIRMDSGPQRMAAFLIGLPQHEGDELVLLRRVFPDLEGSRTSLEKWWSLEVASMGRPGAADFLDPDTTQERLQEALTVRYMEPAKGKKASRKTAPPKPGVEKICQLSDFQQLLRLKKEERFAALSRNQALLLKLSLEAFPLYRAVIMEYRGLAASVIEGKGRGLEERFKNLEELSFRLGEQLRELEDYMNWYEATQLDGKSGAFENYRRSADELERDAPPRRDRISEHLDRVEGRSAE